MMYDEVTFVEKDEKTTREKESKGNQGRDPRGDTGDTKANTINPSNMNEIDADRELSMQIEHRVSVENGSAKWLDYEREDTLQNITIKVRPGELIAIVGQVGAGKSSLLNVILKELRLREGSIQVRAIKCQAETRNRKQEIVFRITKSSSRLLLVSLRIREPR
jgi:ATP-binding cassette subfamily C (CFTR/MRP) protein 4